MKSSSGQQVPKTGVRAFLATVWPTSSPGDSEVQRRKKLAVRSGQLGVVMMVTAAVVGSVAWDFHQFSLWYAVRLAGASLVYIAWSLYGMRDAVRLLLWEQNTMPQVWPPRASWKLAFYFAVQLGLAGLVCYWSGQGRERMLAWLVLLPPVAHSVILLRAPGIFLVSLVSAVILGLNVLRWHGWGLVPNALLAYSFAVLFTLIFTLLAASSEKARWEVQILAGKLREYAVQAEELAATRERNRLAREIHDSLGHYLTVVNVQIAAARAVQDHDLARARDALDKAQSLTQEGLKEIRRSVAALRASPVENKPLVEALRELVEESLAAGLKTGMEILGQTRGLPPQAALTLYRAGQEGLTNVRKHARTESACLRLDFRTPGKVCLSVSDQGVGASNGVEGGFGLLGLRERAQLLGGRVRVQTAPGAGFSLEVEVPG